MATPSFPPAPERLREMLKDYPMHIDRLQEALNTVVDKPLKATPPFEVAIWVLESRPCTFITEARDDSRRMTERFGRREQAKPGIADSTLTFFAMISITPGFDHHFTDPRHDSQWI